MYLVSNQEVAAACVCEQMLFISRIINMLLESHIMLFYMALQLPFMNSRIFRISLVSDVYAAGWLGIL